MLINIYNQWTFVSLTQQIYIDTLLSDGNYSMYWNKKANKIEMFQGAITDLFQY